MNKLAILLIASALISPAFAQETKAPVKKAQVKKEQVHRPMAKKAKKMPAHTSISSLRRSEDYPWMLPT